MTLHLNSNMQNNYLTITPVHNGHKEIQKINEPKQPDLTFHCNINECKEYFLHPLLLYQHMNTQHPEVQYDEEMDEDDSEDKNEDFLCNLLEPVCELVDLGEETANENDGDSTDDDEDSSSSSSSSSSTSSSNSTTEESTTNTIFENNANIMQKSINLNIPDQSTSIILINAPSNTANAPLLAESITKASGPTQNNQVATVLRSGRGRRSTVHSALQLSSVNKGKPNCFQCSHCEASFLNAGDLSKHVRSHITNKPFQCSICDKTFTHIGSLK